MFNKCILSLISILFCQQSYAGGVSLGSTRLIYPTNKNQVTLKIYNSDNMGNYLVQSWVSDEKGNKVNDFIVTPPLFVIKSNSDNILKIVYTGDKSIFPQDKEKLYFFNSKVIPSLTEKEKNIDNALLISTTTKIKLFIRPDSITENSLDSYKDIKCSYSKNKIKIYNPTPFYMNLTSLTINGKELSSAEIIGPKSDIHINNKNNGDYLSYNFINDYGVQIKNNRCYFL